VSDFSDEGALHFVHQTKIVLTQLVSSSVKDMCFCKICLTKEERRCHGCRTCFTVHASKIPSDSNIKFSKWESPWDRIQVNREKVCKAEVHSSTAGLSLRLIPVRIVGREHG
jgi:hypothetical protein